MGFLTYLNPEGDSVVSKVAESAEYAGAAFGYGYLQNRFRERAAVGPIPADLFAGGILKALSLVPHFWKGKGLVARALKGASPYTNVFGNAGLMAFAHTAGAGLGSQGAGVRRLLIKESDVATAKKALPHATILGDIPKAPHGDFLSPAELERL